MIENIKARLFAKRFNIWKEEIDANDKEGYFIYNKQIYFGNRFLVFLKSNQILFRLDVEEENKNFYADVDSAIDDVQAIDEEFLEWFVKNPSCEEVEVVKGFADGTAYGYNFLGYEIIIPKEEPKQAQEVCNRCDKTLREQMKGCGEITCYRQFLPRQEKLTYTESAKKEEKISNCTMMKRKQETVEDAAEYHVKMQYPMGVEKEFVSYELALELKELGFDEPCFTYYYNITNNIRTGLSVHIHNAWTYAGTKKSETTLAPTFSQTFKFFREKYKLPSWVYTSDNEKFYYGILRDTRFLIDGNKPCETYEEAEWACLLKLIEVTKNK